MTLFELSEKFQPLYKSGKPLFVTSDGYIIADDGRNINYLDRKSLQKIDHFNNRNEEVTCFVAGCDDYTVILANKSLMLKKINRFDRSKKPKIWNSCHTAPVFTMCMNRSSTRLATGGADNKIRIWHIGEGEGISYSCIHHKSKICILRNHPTNQIVVSSSLLEHEIVAWDTETGKRLGIFTGHQGIVTGIDFHADTNQMATSSRDETVIVWNCENFTKIFLIPALESVETCIILNGFMNQPELDDYLIMFGGVSGVMKTISPHKKSIVQEFKKASLFANISPEDVDSDKSGLKTIRSIMQFDNSIIVTRESDNIEFYSKELMQLEYELAGDVGDVKDIVLVGKNKDLLLAVESAPYMRLFTCQSFFSEDDDEKTRTEEEINNTNKNNNNKKKNSEKEEKLSQWPNQLICGGHTKEITSVSVFSDGVRIASGGKDGKVCIWQVEDNSKLQLKLITSLSVDNEFVVAVCVDKSGKYIYVHYSVGDSLAVLSLKHDKLTRLSSVRSPHLKPISTMAVNINSSLLATGSKDKLVKLWSYQGGSANEIINKGILKGHKRCVTSVQFSDLEQILLTSSLDKSVNMWSIETLSLIKTIHSTEMIYKALFYNNEKQIIACDSNGEVLVWNKDNTELTHNVNIHDEMVDCLTLIYDCAGKCKGFAAAGSSSMMCLYKDESEKQLEKLKQEKEIENKEQQELDNLLFEKKYLYALKLAIKLNKPLLTFNTLNAILSNEDQIYEELRPFQLLDETDVGKSIQHLNVEEIQRLLTFSVKWITNRRTLRIGEMVIGIILSYIPDLELSSWPEYANHLVTLEAYSESYHRFWNEKVSTTGFYDYLMSAASQFIDLTMDTS